MKQQVTSKFEITKNTKVVFLSFIPLFFALWNFISSIGPFVGWERKAPNSYFVVSFITAVLFSFSGFFIPRHIVFKKLTRFTTLVLFFAYLSMIIITSYYLPTFYNFLYTYFCLSSGYCVKG